MGKLLNTIKSVQKIHNQNLDIEGLLLTMYDSRLRLSNQVVEEVQKHFDEMVFKTIIQRNVRLSEAPSYGESIINYDAGSKGASNYLSLAQEIIKAKATKKQALGRGLSALLKDPDNDIKTATDKGADKVVGNIVELDLNAVEVNPFQPRSSFNEDALKELASSIRELGVIQPITVRKISFGKYQLVSGERRFRASKIVGLETIPAYIRIANDQESLEMALVENIQREDLDPIEIALSYQRLIEEINLTQEQMSDRVGKNRSTIANYLRLLKLDPIIQTGMRDGFLSMGHGRALINIENTSDRYL